MDLQELKNTYAIEQGYEDWNEIRKEFREKAVTFVEMTGHENAVIIRAQKAALEKAAENGMVRLNFNNLNDNSGISEKRFKIRDTAGFYDVDSNSITNKENLIR